MPRPTIIPQPHEAHWSAGRRNLPRRGVVAIEDQCLRRAAEEIAGFLPGAKIAVAVNDLPDDVRIMLDPAQPRDGYTLDIDGEGIRIAAQSPAGAFYAAQTLRQIVAQADGGKLACVSIRDWADFESRGVYYDMCRGRVPLRERMFEQIELLARHKINELQYYVEHTFQWRAHPKIGRNAGSLTPEDVLEVDAFCRDRFIEFVPSLASFGHMANILTLPEYRHLAEDYGVGKYVSNDAQIIPTNGWTLSPANPEIYEFLDALFAEFLPLFSTDRFNVCCDETWDLGIGQSHELCKKHGKGRVYLEHLKKLRDLAARYGKRIMFWGDIIRHSPELIDEIPEDVTVLDWGYTHDYPFETIRDFRKAGLPFYACPGTNGWCGLFPRIHMAETNIDNFARAAHKNGAQGLLNTDWGDGGHFNFMEFSWPGYLFGAEKAWNVETDRPSFNRRFCREFIGTDDKALADAIDVLGEVSCIYYAHNAYFGKPGDDVFVSDEKLSWVARGGQVRTAKRTAAFAAKQEKRLLEARATIARHKKARQEDPHRILEYWLFAADTLLHVTRKAQAFCAGGEDTPDVRRELKKELRGLKRRFERLWLARSRRSEIRITLGLYDEAIDAL